MTAAKAVLITLVITVACGLLLLLGGTAIAYSTSDPGSLAKPVSLVSLGLTALACGITSGCVNRRGELNIQLMGAISAAAFVLLMLLLSVIPTGVSGDISGSEKLLTIAGFLGVSVLGTFFVKKRGRRRKHGYPQKKKRPRR